MGKLIKKDGKYFYEKICEICKKEYLTNHNKSKFCSKKCNHVGQSKKIILICKTCEKSFSISPSHNYKIYCSNECYHSDKNIKINCDYCSKIVKKKKCNIKNNKNVFCNRKCASLFMRKDKKQNQGRRSPEDLLWKKQLLIKFNYKCQNCSTDRKLEAHHIKKVELFPELRHDINNGIIFCHDCHYYGIHNGSPNYKHGKFKKVKNKKTIILKENLLHLKDAV